MIEFLVPVRTLGPNARGHWAVVAARARLERQSTAWTLAGLRRPRLPVRVTFTRLSPGWLDDDNLRGACKAIRDEIAVWLDLPVSDARTGQRDDSDPRVEWLYAQERVQRRMRARPADQIGVRVRVEPRDLFAGSPLEAR